MKTLLWLLIPALLIIGSHCGKNLFPSPTGLRESTAEGLIELGNEAKRDRDFAKALVYYTRVTKEYPRITDGWYLKAEMELRVEGITLPKLVNELQSENTKKLPFFPDSTLSRRGDDSIGRVIIRIPGRAQDTVIKKTPLDSLYDYLTTLVVPSFKAYNDLKVIFDKKATEGLFTEEKIRLDFTMLSSLHTALVSLDMPPFGVLDNSYQPANNERKLYKVMGKGLRNIDSVDIDINEVKNLYDGPDDINGLIDNLLASAEVSLATISNLDAEIQASTAEGIDKSMMTDPKKQMETIILKANFYYYKDKKDNDFDYFNTNGDSETVGGVKVPVVQRTIWIDTSDHAGDGKRDGPGENRIDWVDPAGSGLRLCITDTLLIMRSDTELTRYAAPLGKRFKETASGDSVYEYMEYPSASGKYLFRKTIRGSDKYMRFQGPHGGEFIAGDWGVDEEQIDEVDNDGDGLEDEDSRNASDTLDNDFDFIKVDTSDTCNPTLTYCPDLDGSRQSTGKKAFDSLSIALKPTSKMLWVDYDGDGRIDGPGPGHNHLTKDSIKLHLAAVKNDINSGLAYGEWLSGDWGIDEEYMDGIDNDGDGRIDEDGDVHLIHRIAEYWSQSQRVAYLDMLKTFFSNPASLVNIRGTR